MPIRTLQVINKGGKTLGKTDIRYYSIIIIIPIYYHFMKKKFFAWISLSLILIAAMSPFAIFTSPIPVTGKFQNFSINQLRSPDNFSSFINMVATNRNSNQVVGIYQHSLLKAPVVQQPSNLPGYVSSEADKVTQFSLPKQFGVTALLAHNYLIGQNFHKITIGSYITVIYGNRKTEIFQVADIREYQALSPNSPYSSFINVADRSNKKITANTLFYDIYTQKDRLVLQTCIERDGDLSWGRLFIIASRVDPYAIAPIQ